jgi:ABC-type microcin C transport system duplicated ATPase subunit YejF
MIYDPLASLNLRMTLGQIILHPLEDPFSQDAQTECAERVAKVMARAGLAAQHGEPLSA